MNNKKNHKMTERDREDNNFILRMVGFTLIATILYIGLIRPMIAYYLG